jgi:phosphoribosylformylglycinamidine (FGAM) synthase-like enzyme
VGIRIPSEIDGLFGETIAKTTTEIPRPWLLSVFSDNSGIVALDEEQAFCMKVETHNAPSALDPYGGALTGILGVNRDILGSGFGATTTNSFYINQYNVEGPAPVLESKWLVPAPGGVVGFAVDETNLYANVGFYSDNGFSGIDVYHACTGAPSYTVTPTVSPTISPTPEQKTKEPIPGITITPNPTVSPTPSGAQTTPTPTK